MKNKRKYFDLLPADTVVESMDSPVGELLLIASSAGLHGVFFSPTPAVPFSSTSPGLSGGSIAAIDVPGSPGQAGGRRPTGTYLWRPEGRARHTRHHEERSDVVIQSNQRLHLHKTKIQLTEYFAGKRKHFDLPLAPYGTDFQQQAWQQLCRIPYGETISYGEQASRLGDKKKARAIGMANNRNPISIIVPCHRVIGANGQLTGFGGGLDTKAFLLELEQTYYR